MRTCSDCGKTIGLKSRTGRCRKHALLAVLKDPEVQARRRAALVKACNDPTHRRSNSERMKAYCRDPAVKAKRSADSRRICHLTIGSEKARRAASSPASINKRILTYSRRHMAWCPPDRIAEYKRLIRSKGLRSSEAKRTILESLTPFERQMQAVRNGAQLIEKPILRKREHDFTLGGVTDWAA